MRGLAFPIRHNKRAVTDPYLDRREPYVLPVLTAVPVGRNGVEAAEAGSCRVAPHIQEYNRRRRLISSEDCRSADTTVV